MKCRKLFSVCFAMLPWVPAFAEADSNPLITPEAETRLDIRADTNGGGKAGIYGSGSGGFFGWSFGAVFGAVSIDSMNYQQIGLRPELRLGELAVAFDISLLFDNDGKIRNEDWDDWKDYLDKIYYIRYGERGAPFYFKIGSIDSSTLGRGAIINGYRNTVEYPSYKKQGLDIGFDTAFGGAQMIVGDFKELTGRNKAVMMGGRLFGKPISRLQAGFSLAGDFNEYKGLHDRDDDGVPDRIDAFPDDKRYATTADYYKAHGASAATVAELVALGLISDEVLDYNNRRSRTGFWGADGIFTVYDGNLFRFDIYAQFAQSLNTVGWGVTAPGFRAFIGRSGAYSRQRSIESLDWGSFFVSFAELYGDYRVHSEKFMFGYYNDTYDIERAGFIDNGSGALTITTKKDKLNGMAALRGYLAGIKLNMLFDVLAGRLEYQDMCWGSKDSAKKDRSIRAGIDLNPQFLSYIPLISKAGFFYVQSNVSKFRIKSESTMWGGVLGLGLAKGVSVDFTYTVTYADRNGDGRISGGSETNTNISVSTVAVL